MKIYVLGNQDLDIDRAAFSVAGKFSDEFKSLEFVELKPNEDLPFDDNSDVTILDVTLFKINYSMQ